MFHIDGIYIAETQIPPQLTDITAGSRLFLNTRYVSDFVCRTIILQQINQALQNLPSDLGLMIYEAYRPRSRQLKLWNDYMMHSVQTDPDLTEIERTLQAENFVSNPYKFGSGHQAAAAIDITLCDLNGHEIDMGTPMHAFNAKTQTDCADLSTEIVERRHILKNTLEQTGLINYPSEWWHYSFGDRLWAEVTGRDFAFFAPID